MDKKAFSLIELIFMIIVMGIVATVAIPKLMNIKNNASVSSIKQDINTVVSSVQNYFLINGKIDKISDAVVLNNSVWSISDKEIKYIENTKDCIDIKLDSNTLVLSMDESVGEICKELADGGIVSTSYELK